MIIPIFAAITLFLLISSNLLLSLVILELLGFLVIFLVASHTSVFSSSDFLLLFLFSVLVIEGVIALSGIITLVSFTGSDFTSASSVFKC